MVFLDTSAELLDPRVPSVLKPRDWGSASSEMGERISPGPLDWAGIMATKQGGRCSAADFGGRSEATAFSLALTRV